MVKVTALSIGHVISNLSMLCNSPHTSSGESEGHMDFQSTLAKVKVNKVVK